MRASGAAPGVRRVLSCLLGIALVGSLIGCGDDGGDGASASELKKRLVPADQVGLEVEREFEWDNPIDFVTQGVFFAEATAPSELIGQIDDAGLIAAAGEVLKDKRGGIHVFVDAATFDSADGATEARDALHAEDLKQPCFAACTVSPVEYAFEGIPDSVAVHHAPNPGKPPPGHFKFEGYLVEFTIGNDLYLAQMDGPPGIPKARVNRIARAVYEYAAAHD
jgi:hypothetical protein